MLPELQQPNIVGNFLSSYGTAQAQQQAQQDRALNQQRMAKQDQRADQQFEMEMDAGQLQLAVGRAEAFDNILRKVRPGDEASLNQAKSEFVNTFGGDPQAVAGVTMDRVMELRAESDLKLKELRARIAATDRSNRGGAGGGSGPGNAALQRAQLAQAYGIDPTSPAGQKYVLTGQLPASLSPTDKKAILEADQMVMASQQGMTMLNQAKTLNPKAAGGFGMGTLAEVFAQIGDETALNTRDLENILQSNVLPQLKVIFGGAPTEGERQILLDLQGSANKTVEERRRIIDRSIAAANARIKFYQDQAQDLRGGTYYNPTRGQQPAAPAAAPAASGAPAPAAGGFSVRKVR
jgi:hypothetical protein